MHLESSYRFESLIIEMDIRKIDKLQDSHILRVDPTFPTFCQSLLNILDRRHWGLMEPAIDNPESFTPLLVFLSQVMIMNVNFNVVCCFLKYFCILVFRTRRVNQS